MDALTTISTTMSFDTTLSTPPFPSLSGDSGTVIQLVIIWGLTTLFYILAKKQDWHQWDTQVPFTSVNLGQLVGIVIAILSGILSTIAIGLLNHQSLAQSEVWKQGLEALIGAIGMHGVGGKFISAKIERMAGINQHPPTPPNSEPHP